MLRAFVSQKKSARLLNRRSFSAYPARIAIMLTVFVFAASGNWLEIPTQAESTEAKVWIRIKFTPVDKGTACDLIGRAAANDNHFLVMTIQPMTQAISEVRPKEVSYECILKRCFQVQAFRFRYIGPDLPSELVSKLNFLVLGPEDRLKFIPSKSTTAINPAGRNWFRSPLPKFIRRKITTDLPPNLLERLPDRPGDDPKVVLDKKSFSRARLLESCSAEQIVAFLEMKRPPLEALRLKVLEAEAFPLQRPITRFLLIPSRMLPGNTVYVETIRVSEFAIPVP